MKRQKIFSRWLTRSVHSLVAFMVRDGLRHVQDKEFEVSWMFDRICRLPEDMQPPGWPNLLNEPVRCEVMSVFVYQKYAVIISVPVTSCRRERWCSINRYISWDENGGFERQDSDAG
ncbi:predicted protein [Sclerotinia sclerotiorum 1980 UF-70]|uniref:Uncharacterized protein n=1 Tax=Sclerotinia sclerotiorum (strain ATCC 18683 / 1980 / Ss-1) TaxID=665079 RepID=A7EEC4_SCLS1|nr:predicted protein [Sclerotinia sclerotiorum 1980 UF-70]EDO01190.1 predicted protein [Sclerotinia sclerotiorum 1980 UF-70]